MAIPVRRDQKERSMSYSEWSGQMSVAIPGKYVTGEMLSYTGSLFLELSPPPSAGLEGYVIEVPAFLAERKAGKLTIRDGRGPFLCRFKDPPKGTRHPRRRLCAADLAEMYADDIRRMEDSRRRRAKRRAAMLSRPGRLVVAWYNRFGGARFGAAMYEPVISVGLVPDGGDGRWMYDAELYDLEGDNAAKGRHDRESSAYREVESFDVADVAEALEKKGAYLAPAKRVVSCHRALRALEANEGALLGPLELTHVGGLEKSDLDKARMMAEAGRVELERRIEEELASDISKRLAAARAEVESALGGLDGALEKRRA